MHYIKQFIISEFSRKLASAALQLHASSCLHASNCQEFA